MTVTMAEAYNDPTADVKLQSEDGRVFRVHSYMLKANSLVFRSMFSTCATSSVEDTEESPIPLDFRSDSVTDFLDLMHSETMSGKWTWKRSEALLALIDKYECPSMRSTVLLQLYDYPRQGTWKVFAIASHAGRLALARIAIANFPNNMETHKFSMFTLSLQMASEVRLDYMLGLLQATQLASTDGKVDWKRAAELFEPLKQTP